MKESYEEYLKLPIGNIHNFRDNELLKNNWMVYTGRSFAPPHPHRHFTFEEFVERCNKDEIFHKRFIKE